MPCYCSSTSGTAVLSCAEILRQMEESDEHSDESLQGSRASLAVAQLSGKWFGPIWIQSLDVGPVYVRTFSLQASPKSAPEVTVPLAMGVGIATCIWVALTNPYLEFEFRIAGGKSFG